MFDFLYYIIIFPIYQIMEISFAILYRIFGNKVLSIAGVSVAVTICTMPLYFIAEKWQQAERNLQKKLKPKVDKIKSVLKGDEQYMVLSAFYRQNHYHPVYVLRNSFGILVQIPFFIAAYSYISQLDFIKGVSFWFIHDLGTPDRFLALRGFYFNVLPIIMTMLNIVSGTIYSKGFANRDKFQIYCIALVFLLLLYNSPSGLVLYWTMNNLFSLIKNILVKIKHGPMVVYLLGCLCVFALFIYFVPVGFSPKRLFVVGFCSLFFFVPLFIRLFRFLKNKALETINFEQCSLSASCTFIFSALILFVLSGLVIPAALFASSVQEFSFLDSYTTPLPFLYPIAFQAMGIFLFWPLCVYLLVAKKIKYFITIILSLLCITALINTFLFPGDYGVITTTFKFSNPDTFESKYAIILSNAIVTLSILGLTIYFLLTKRKIIFQSFQLIIFSALVIFSFINILKINNDFKEYDKFIKGSSKDITRIENQEPVYQFTRNGKNVIVFMLDAAISGYVPYIFEEKPELLRDFSGFTYYPNCISFGPHTRIGAPLIFGGYEYQPGNIQKNRSYAMEKHNEALLMMPLIFLNENYNVTVTDPTFANYSLTPDLSVFTPYPKISAYNIQGNYTDIWLRSHPELNIVSIPELLKELLIRFSFLKTAPLPFRVFIYDKAYWLKPGSILSDYKLSLDTMDCYTTLDYMPLLTGISDEKTNTYTAIVNDLAHMGSMFQYPDYIPVMDITNTGDGPFATDDRYHTTMAAFLLLGKWFRYLQEQGVYDNTRIIIASDHGRNVNAKYDGNIALPNGHWLSSYHALLLVKDFNSREELVTNTNFMTHGDVPAIVMENLINDPKNPFSGNSIKADKENGVLITTSSPFKYTIAKNQWLFVHDNIFDPRNWEKAEK